VGLVDDIIDPRDTRSVIAWGLELARKKHVEAVQEARRHSGLNRDPGLANGAESNSLSSRYAAEHTRPGAK